MAVWISKFLGPIILVLSIPMIATPNSLHEVTKKFLADSPLVLISGVLAMVAGLSIVNSHNVWEFRWPVIITVFGWALVLGGAIRVAAPGVVNIVGTTMMDHPTITRVAGVIWGCLGAFLTFKGYA